MLKSTVDDLAHEELRRARRHLSFNSPAKDRQADAALEAQRTTLGLAKGRARLAPEPVQKSLQEAEETPGEGAAVWVRIAGAIGDIQKAEPSDSDSRL